ncbi:MAG: hypothetical protein RIM72_00285 [Alphaproteobacteria bacterium]
MIEFEKAKLDPGSHFRKPGDVLASSDFSNVQKIEILRRWEYDANELAVAEEEGLTGGEPSMLEQILKALETLVEHIDTEHSPPTKQHGLSQEDLKRLR